MKNTLSISFAPALLAVLAFCLAAPPAHAVKGRPSAITYDDLDADRVIYAFVKGDNGHLVSNHFNGTYWAWTDHGVPAGSASISNPKAVTYRDELGNRRIYVFAVDNTGQLVVRFHKGGNFGWQWSKQGGPSLVNHSLSATTFVDDNGVRRIDAFAFRTNPGGAAPYRLVRHFWNGNAWNWADMATVAGQPYNNASFTEVTSYKGNDDRMRMDIFCEGGDNRVLLRHSFVEGAFTVTNLNGLVQQYASVVNYTNSSGYRQVELFARNPAYQTIWGRNGASWSEVGKPAAANALTQGFISATTYKVIGMPRIDLYVEWDHKLYWRVWVNQSWQSWVDLGSPSTAGGSGVDNPTAITYLDERGGYQYTWVFMVGGADDDLYVNRWNGTGWDWFNRGNP